MKKIFLADVIISKATTVAIKGGSGETQPTNSGGVKGTSSRIFQDVNSNHAQGGISKFHHSFS